MLFPFAKVIEKLAIKFIPDKQDEHKVFLDERLLLSPNLAISEAHNKAIKMSSRVEKNVIYATYKRRKNKSQDNKSKLGVEYNNEIGEFQSVEEIHFIFVQMNQKKKAFFENNFNESVDV